MSRCFVQSRLPESLESDWEEYYGLRIFASSLGLHFLICKVGDLNRLASQGSCFFYTPQGLVFTHEALRTPGCLWQALMEY